MTVLFATSVKVTAILIVALAALGVLRRQSAATRHWVLGTAVACALLIPALAAVVPSWRMSSMRVEQPQVESRMEFRAGPPSSPATGDATVPSDPPPPVPGARAGSTLIAVWIAGMALTLGVLVLGFARVASISAAARPAGPGRCADIAEEVAREYGIGRRVRLLYGSHPAMLVTWGLFRPAIVLPEAARTWADERLRVVLCHELAHVRRGDWGTQLAAELLRAIQWFNPVAWMVCRRLRRESEHACDDAVLNAGVAGPIYAAHLLDLARAHSARRVAWSPALPVARPSGLERRVRAMLNAHLNRHPVTRGMRVASALLFLPLAAAVAGVALFAQGPFATVSGSIVDSMRGTLPNAALTITNGSTRARNEVRSDGNGRFEFVGLPPGDYVLEVAVPGFKPYRTAVAVNGQQVNRDIVMDVATLQETITVADVPPTPRSPAEQQALDRRNALQTKRLMRASAACRETATSAGATGGTAVGGRIRPPMKIVDVRPEYPAALREAKIGGTVELEARIGIDGSVVDARAVDPSAQPELVGAALDAVRQWRFDETLLNCVPIEVSMNVSVTFRPRQ